MQQFGIVEALPKTINIAQIRQNCQFWNAIIGFLVMRVLFTQDSFCASTLQYLTPFELYSSTRTSFCNAVTIIPRQGVVSEK